MLDIKINEAPGEVYNRKGYARYPDDFDYLKVPDDFCFWLEPGKSILHVETILPAEAVRVRLQELQKILDGVSV